MKNLNEKYVVTCKPWEAADLVYDTAIDIVEALNDDPQYIEYVGGFDYVVSEFVDNVLSWHDNSWEILKMYCLPTEVNYFYAVECFIDDIQNIIEEV